MQRRRWWLWLWLAILPGVVWPQGTEPTWQELQKQYALPADLPLEAAREKLSETGDGTLYKVTYRSINAQKVPALLYLPKLAKSPMPVVVFQHGLGSTKEQILNDQVKAALAKEGFAGFAIDAALHGERKETGKEPREFFSTVKQPVFQTVADLRRGVDYLATVPEVDAKRIGFYGISMGGFLGALATGLDPRFRAVALVVAWADWGAFTQNSEMARKAAESYLLTPELVRQLMADVDPLYFVGHISPRPILMENGRTDKLIPTASAEALHKAAKEPKQVRWYPGGHEIYADPDAMKDALDFLEKNLKA